MTMLLFVTGVLLTIANLEALGVGAANPFEKAVFLAFGLAFASTRPLIRANLCIAGFIVFVTWACAEFSEWAGFSWERYVRSLASLIALLLVFVARPRRRDQIVMLAAIALTPLLASGLGVFYSLAGVRGMWGVGDSGADRFQGSIIAASMGAAACAGIFAALRLADLHHRGFLAVAGLNFVPLALSGARTAMAATIVSSGAAMLLGFRQDQRKKVIAIIFGSVGAGLAGLVLLDRVVARFENSGMNGREILWATLKDSLVAHPWLGVGLGHQNLLIPVDVARATRTDAAHNEFLRFAVEMGYVGVIAFFAFFAAMLATFFLRRDYAEKAILFFCIASFALFCVTDNAFSVTHIYMLLVAGVISCHAGKDSLLFCKAHGHAEL